MPVRIFLGYDSPFLPNLVSHLLKDRDSLADSLIIVPTGQSGRMLRESLAAEAGALLAPAVSTPGALLRIDNPKVAPPWIEKLAWTAALESVADWENYPDLFPVPPNTGDGSTDWAVSLASELVTLRTSLQEKLHNLFSASKFLASTPEAARWENLARLEDLAEKQLAAWGLVSRTSSMRRGFSLPAKQRRIILAGITEMPSCLRDALMTFPGEVISLIAAPESDHENFCPLGLPLVTWAARELPLHASVRIVADPASQAKAALDAVSSHGASSAETSLGSADEKVGSALAREFTASGWIAFHPAAAQPQPALIRWLRAWKDWLTKPSSRHLAAMLSLPESAALIPGGRAQTLLTLNGLRDRHPAIEPPEIIHRLAGSEVAEKIALHSAVTSLLARREAFFSAPFPEALTIHLRELRIGSESSLAMLSHIGDFTALAAPIFRMIQRSHMFWLRALLTELPSPTPQPPADRAIDVQGWLELLYEPGTHLVICGMNETYVPSRCGGEPWLSENTRNILGLGTDSDRHARDAYLLHAMLMMRKSSGSAHLICGKNGAGGEPLLPSRLLLHVPRTALVPTVRNLFREIEPPESDLVWTRDWKWQPPHIAPPAHINATSLRDYLACPFRYYLKHFVRMSAPDPDRREMNARDFGNITHRILENWANDPSANRLTDPAKITAYLEAELDSVVFREFGKKPQLAIRIQTQAIRQRLEWFAARQAEAAAEGWETIAAEKEFLIPSGDTNIKGKIDRIDRHRETGQLRVIDYKTGNLKKSVDGEHRTKLTASTRLPTHIPQDAPPFHLGTDGKGKPTTFIWQNLQLPLYSLATRTGDQVPIPCYVQLGKTEADVKFTAWDTFSEADLASAKSCADWITSMIAQCMFWPPSEKVPYDDFAPLTQNAPAEGAFEPPATDSRVRTS